MAYNPYLSRDLIRVQKLPFTDECTVQGELVFVTLTPMLRAVLPEHLITLRIPTQKFTVETVIDHYEVIVDYLTETAQTANEYLRLARNSGTE
ncbi:hypothetical protein [Spirosoma oryzicola]|nr:hypothetical protein [Spirosoma oryzicola]UHG92341.1 hypothetical protein LQ777_05410 [Spirosoma oryzicola]